MSEPIKKISQLPTSLKIVFFALTTVAVVLLLMSFPFVPFATYPLETGIESDKISVKFSTDLEPISSEEIITQEASSQTVDGITYYLAPQVTKGTYKFPAETVTLQLYLAITLKTIATESFQVSFHCEKPLNVIIHDQAHTKDPTKTTEDISFSYEVRRSLGTWSFFLLVSGDHTIYGSTYMERWDVVITWGIPQPTTTEPTTTTTTESTTEAIAADETTEETFPVSDVGSIFIIGTLTILVIVRRVRK